MGQDALIDHGHLFCVLILFEFLVLLLLLAALFDGVAETRNLVLLISTVALQRSKEVELLGLALLCLESLAHAVGY